MESLLPLFAGLALGAFLGWLLGTRSSERAAAGRIQELGRQAADAAARVEEKEGALRLQRQTAEDLKQELERSFQALAGEALQRNTAQLITQADLKFQPFDAKLEQLRAATEALESRRAQAYGSLDQQLKELKQSTSDLRAQSEKLGTALRGSSQARGRWGESTLRRLVEMAGMLEHCDFDEQSVTAAGLRPDLVVRLPGRGAIPVDAKVPLAAFLDAAAATDEDQRRAFLHQHAGDLKAHVVSLAKREYPSDPGISVDFTVLFVPGEPFLAAAFLEDPDLFEWALERKVLISSPVTLLALLRTVRLNWDHVEVEKNALEIRDVALRLFESVRVFSEHFERVGAGLERSVDAYNKAVRSYERNVQGNSKRLAELRIGENKGMPELAAVPHPLIEAAPGERAAGS